MENQYKHYTFTAHAFSKSKNKCFENLYLVYTRYLFTTYAVLIYFTFGKTFYGQLDGRHIYTVHSPHMAFPNLKHVVENINIVLSGFCWLRTLFWSGAATASGQHMLTRSRQRQIRPCRLELFKYILNKNIDYIVVLMPIHAAYHFSIALVIAYWLP